jgi:hypothetical protein
LPTPACLPATDISDVVFRRDPFELLRVVGDRIYAGRDYGNSMTQNRWLKPRHVRHGGQATKHCAVADAGIIMAPSFRVEVCFTAGANAEAGFDMDHYEVLRNKSQVYNAGLVGGYADTVCIVATLIAQLQRVLRVTRARG